MGAMTAHKPEPRKPQPAKHLNAAAKQGGGRGRGRGRDGARGTGTGAAGKGTGKATGKIAGKGTGKGPIAGIMGMWRQAGLGRRIAIAATGITAVLCIIALIVGLVALQRWRAAVQAVEAQQQRLAEQYDFNPGDIISDGQFFNPNAMSQAEVQSFLESHGSALATMTFDTQDQPADDQCAAYEGATGETAATIIDKSAHACGISQKVLLTVLQKEQHLITTTNPTEFQLKAAMGLSCPDDADCDPQYAGFFNQVYGAANRYQYYTRNEDRYGYHAGTLNTIQYHPDASCGASEVYIENKATALLYIYTPYQPNEAALAAGDGEGDSCSSYGNRNFALIYANWFGNPRS